MAPAAFQELQLIFANENATRLAMMLQGEAHMTRIPTDLEPTAEAGGMRKVFGGAPVQAMYTMFGGQFVDPPPEGNVRKLEHPDLPGSDIFHDVTENPFVDRRVRRALNHAIDRNLIRETLLGGNGDLMPVSQYHPSLRGWNPEWLDRWEAEYGYNPDMARALLAEVEEEIGQPLAWENTVNHLTFKAPAYPVGGCR